MIAPEWQLALAALVGFLIGCLCTYVACCLEARGERREAPEEQVGADSDPGALGAPQGRPDDAQRA
jgi:hypothetical protein